MSVLDLMMQQEAMKALENLNKPSKVGLLGQPQSALQAGLLGGLKGITPYTGYSTTPTTFGQAISGALTGVGSGVQDFQTQQSKENLERLGVLSTVKDVLTKDPTDWVTVASTNDPATPIYVRKGEEGLTDQSGQPLYQPYIKPEYKQNFRITETEDGVKVETLWEDPSKAPSEGPEGEMQKKVVQDLQTKLVESKTQSDKLFSLLNKFDPSFLTYGGKINSKLLELKDKVGVTPLAPEEQQFLESFSAFEQEAAEGLNLYIKYITGAQMSEAEAQRLKLGYPNLEDSPVQFQTKLTNLALNNELSIARTNFFIKNKQMFIDKGINVDNPYAVNEEGKTIKGEANLADIVKLDVNNPTVATNGSIQEIIIQTADAFYKDLESQYPEEDKTKIVDLAIEETERYFGANLRDFLQAK